MRKFASLVPSVLSRRSLTPFATYSKYPFLKELGLKESNDGAFYDGKWQVTDSKASFDSVNPSDGEVVTTTRAASLKDYEKAISAAKLAQKQWASVTMPKRGDIVRQIGEALRHHLSAIGNTISLEMGKIEAEGIGEVQEFIDVCDMACGLSRSIG